jgi:hypothetical protein
LKYCNHGPTEDFFNNLLAYSYAPTITLPTRISDTSATLIDNIFINNISLKCKSGIVYSDISDHLPVIIHLSSAMNVKNLSYTKTRCYDAKSIENFNIALSNDSRWVDLDRLSLINNDPSSAYERFYFIYRDNFDKCFPEKNIKLNSKSIPQNEWMTRGLLRSCHKRSRLYKKFKSEGAAKDKENYVLYRNKLKTILKKAQKTFYHEKFKLLAGNLHQTWKLLGSIAKNHPPKNSIDFFTVNGVKIDNKNEIANKLNEYFVNIGNRLAESIPPSTTSFSSYLKEDYMNSMCLFLTDANEIINIVSNLKNKVSYGYDCIPVNIMKASIHSVAQHLSDIINSSLQTGIFPDQLKIAKICPIFKNGEKDVFASYRPISILPSFSKIFEKVLFNRMICYIESNKILTNNQ